MIKEEAFFSLISLISSMVGVLGNACKSSVKVAALLSDLIKKVGDF